MADLWDLHLKISVNLDSETAPTIGIFNFTKQDMQRKHQKTDVNSFSAATPANSCACMYADMYVQQSRIVNNLGSGVFVPQLFVREPEERLGVKGNIRQHSFFSSTDWSALEQRHVAPPFKPTLVSTAGSMYRLHTT